MCSYIFEPCGTDREGKQKERKRQDKKDSIAPDLHKQPFQNEHQFTSLGGMYSVQW